MAKSTFDINDIRTFWGCVAQAEQRVLWALSELAQTPTQSVSFTDVKAMMIAYGGKPAEERTRLLFERYPLHVVDDSHLLCGDPDGCVLLQSTPYFGQLWSCRLLGECELGSPVDPPCYYKATDPFA